MHPGRTANIFYNGERIGLIGQIHPTEQKKRDLKNTYVMEMNLAKIFAIETDELVYVQVPRFPSISRDIALVVSSETSAGMLEHVIRNAGGKLLKTFRLFDLYEGDECRGRQEIRCILVDVRRSRAHIDGRRSRQSA